MGEATRALPRATTPLRGVHRSRSNSAFRHELSIHHPDPTSSIVSCHGPRRRASPLPRPPRRGRPPNPDGAAADEATASTSRRGRAI
eukprot:scaffold168444_cov31-Tisochrysis_lutea.AAC.3